MHEYCIEEHCPTLIFTSNHKESEEQSAKKLNKVLRKTRKYMDKS